MNTKPILIQIYTKDFVQYKFLINLLTNTCMTHAELIFIVNPFYKFDLIIQNITEPIWDSCDLFHFIR